MQDLINLHPDASNASSLSCRDQFNTWMYLHDLCSYGPDFFHQFKSMLQEPESVEQIPLVKTPIYAARAMDVNNSMVTGNICAVNDLLQQGGISNPAAAQTSKDIDMDSPDISKHVILIHGDLGTGEHLQSAQLCRLIESTPWNRLQHVVFIPGLFHLKMACADALWRCFIYPLTTHEDKTSLMCDIAQIQPKDMSKTTGILDRKSVV